MFTSTEELFSTVQENRFEMPPKITPDWIINCVCEVRGTTIEEMSRKYRGRETVISRQITMFFLKGMTKLSLGEIGKKIGDKDHATVLYACKVINNMIDQSVKYHGEFHHQIDRIFYKISGFSPPIPQKTVEMQKEPESKEPQAEKKPWHKPTIRIIPFPRSAENNYHSQRHEAWDRVIPKPLRKKIQTDSFVGCCY